MCLCVCVSLQPPVCREGLWLTKVDVNEALRGLAVVVSASSKLHTSRLQGEAAY